MIPPAEQNVTWLAITVGEPEGQERTSPTSRPGPIELLGHIITVFGNRLVRVEVTLLYDGIFHADLIFADDRRVPGRPSDAVALSLRGGLPITVARAVLDEAAVEFTLVDDDAGSMTLTPADEGLEVEQFRAQLDEIAP